MSSKSNIKPCRYENCQHGKVVNIDTDEYKIVGTRSYYHVDCYKLKLKEDEIRRKRFSDYDYIKGQWILHIDKTVSIAHLFKVLNDFTSRGIESEYLVFAIDYVIKNKMKLNYPNGFQYYVNNPTIQKAYAKSKVEKIDYSKFVVPQEVFEKDEVYKEPPPAVKPKGFGSILQSKKSNQEE